LIKNLCIFSEFILKTFSNLRERKEGFYSVDRQFQSKFTARHMSNP